MSVTDLLTDHSLDFLRRGYRFADELRASSRDPGAGSRLPLRILGSDALLVRGADGVRLFYDTSAVRRRGAMPSFIKNGLFGDGSVHGLDDEEHRHRKAMFVRSLMGPAASDRVLDEAAREWVETIQERWLFGESASVYDVATEVYGRSLLRWAGVVTDRHTATRIAHAEAAIVDGFAVAGRAWLRTQVMRWWCDRWFRDRVRRARSGEITPPEGTHFHNVLAHRDADGAPLSDDVAAVELQNGIRPGIAVARLAAFAALALHEHPSWKKRIHEEVTDTASMRGGPVALAFADEVRRYYPFVPMLPAVARHDLEVDGAPLSEGHRVLIDIWGTNRDGRHWEDPEQFDPERFLGPNAMMWDDELGVHAADHFVPQGGGRPESGHRCPGERITLALLAQTVSELSTLEARIAVDGLDWSLERMPTRPRNGVLLTGVRRRATVSS